MPTPGNTAIGQTFFQLVSSMGDVNQDWDTTTASGPGAFAVNDANLSGTQIVMGDNDGQMVNGNATDSIIGEHNVGAIDNDGSAINFGAGGVAADGENNNIGSGELYNVEDSKLSETAIGHSQVQSNDIDVDADDGSAVAFGGEAHGANVDADVWGTDGNVAIQAGEDQTQQQWNDESVHNDLDFKFDYDDNDNIHNGDTNTVEDSFKVDDSFNPFSNNHVDNDVFDIA
jgi:hypothetical protein